MTKCQVTKSGYDFRKERNERKNATPPKPRRDEDTGNANKGMQRHRTRAAKKINEKKLKPNADKEQARDISI